MSGSGSRADEESGRVRAEKEGNAGEHPADGGATSTIRSVNFSENRTLVGTTGSYPTPHKRVPLFTWHIQYGGTGEEELPLCVSHLVGNEPGVLLPGNTPGS